LLGFLLFFQLFHPIGFDAIRHSGELLQSLEEILELGQDQFPLDEGSSFYGDAGYADLVLKKQPRGKFTVAAIPRLALHHLFS
jgi:hypothetical protein